MPHYIFYVIKNSFLDYSTPNALKTASSAFWYGIRWKAVIKSAGTVAKSAIDTAGRRTFLAPQSAQACKVFANSSTLIRVPPIEMSPSTTRLLNVGRPKAIEHSAINVGRASFSVIPHCCGAQRRHGLPVWNGRGKQRLAITTAHSIFAKNVTSYRTVAGTRMIRCPLLPKNRNIGVLGHTLSAADALGKALIFYPAF